MLCQALMHSCSDCGMLVDGFQFNKAKDACAIDELSVLYGGMATLLACANNTTAEPIDAA